MLLRPEILGVIGLGISALAILAVGFRLPNGIAGGRPAICPSCGTMQHNLSRTAALAHEFMGPSRCVACGKPLTRHSRS